MSVFCKDWIGGWPYPYSRRCPDGVCGRHTTLRRRNECSQCWTDSSVDSRASVCLHSDGKNQPAIQIQIQGTSSQRPLCFWRNEHWSNSKQVLDFPPKETTWDLWTLWIFGGFKSIKSSAGWRKVGHRPAVIAIPLMISNMTLLEFFRVLKPKPNPNHLATIFLRWPVPSFWVLPTLSHKHFSCDGQL